MNMCPTDKEVQKPQNFPSNIDLAAAEQEVKTEEIL